jgi:hypothetical protein
MPPITLIEEIWRAVRDKVIMEINNRSPPLIYPVGHVCSTVVDKNPSELFGGSWVLVDHVDSVYRWKRTK